MDTTSVAGLRVFETSYEATRGTFLVEGGLEFGAVKAGMQLRLPRRGGKFRYFPVKSVDLVDERIAVRIGVPDGETLEALQEPSLVGQEIEFVRSASDPTDSAAGAGNFFAGLCAVLALSILGIAFFVPMFLNGNKVTGTIMAWEGAAVLSFIGGFALIRKHIAWSVLVLLFACAFLFVSCASNFHLKMT